MRSSQFFLPTLRENPAEAEIVSHRLMLRAGMVRQASAGIYSWLPLGFKVLKNVERIVRDIPVYHFRPDELRYLVVQYVPTTIHTTRNGLSVRFEPAR